MKPISKYIDGLSDGETVPAIKGEILRITPPDDSKETQIITIGTADDKIKLYIKKAHYVVDPVVGSILSAACKKGSPAKGLTLKEGKQSTYISVSDGAILTVEHPMEEADSEGQATPIETEALTPAEAIIRDYVLERLHVNNIVSRVVTEYNDKALELQRQGKSAFLFDTNKIPELATAAHIFYEKSGNKGRIIPTEKQEARKEQVRSVTEAEKATKPKKPAPVEGANKSGGWREVVHPSNGTRLGDVSPEKIKTVLAPWYYRTAEGSGNDKLRDAIGEAIQELGFTPTEMLEGYINEYAKDFAPDSTSTRTDAIIKFCSSIAKVNLTKGDILDGGTATLKQYVTLIKDFGSYWVNFVEDDSKDE